MYNFLLQADPVLDPVATDGITEVNVNVLELLMTGGWYIMLPLAMMSLIAMYVYFERFFAIKKAAAESPDFMNRIKDYISAGQLPSAKNLCAENDTPMARMMEKGVARIGKPLKDIAISIENVGKLEIYKMEKNINILATIAGAAPMVGMLGTVIGMVNVFLDMEAAGTVQVSDISAGKCKVKLSNAEILANPISVKGKGERTTVSLRPERALINPSDKMDNLHNGRIEEVIYHGDHTRVRINLLGNSDFILKIPNSSSNLDIKLGNEIKIGWNSEDARALDPK